MSVPQPWIVDTNVVVAGVIGTGGPPARIVDAMLDGELLFAMSADLFEEYASVLRRPAVARLHKRADDELYRLLGEIAANATWRTPEPSMRAPDPGDNHIWALLADLGGGRLVTGDRLLQDNPPDGASVLSPRGFVDRFLSESSAAEPEQGG